MVAQKSIWSSAILHTATISLQRSYCQTYSGYPRVGSGIFLSTGRCTGASSAWHRRFPGAKGARLHISNTAAANSPDLNPVDYSIWSVLQEKVYHPERQRRPILKMRLIDNWAVFDQWSWKLLFASGAVASALVSVERGTLWALSVKFQIYLVMYY